MNEDFAYLVELFGPPVGGELFGTEDADAWNGKLPSGLIELWRAYGIGLWARGKFQFCHPGRYAAIVELMLAGDPEFALDETHMFGFGAFGDVLLWNETRQKLQISLPYLRGRADVSRQNWKAIDPNIAVTSPLTRIGSEDSFVLYEDQPPHSPMFTKCLKKHGGLSLGECYGLFPALALGGSTDVGSVRRVRALEHFAILAQLGPIQLVDFLPSGDMRAIRNLGAQG